MMIAINEEERGYLGRMTVVNTVAALDLSRMAMRRRFGQELIFESVSEDEAEDTYKVLVVINKV